MGGQRIKRRYPRQKRYRTIVSNNLDLRQTRRQPLIPTIDISGAVVTLSFNRAIVVPSDALTTTAVTAGGTHGDLVSVTVDPADQTKAIFDFDTGTPTNFVIPFEDKSVRDQVGAYMLQGTYTEPG